MIFPANFDHLHTGEEFIRSKSKEAIQQSNTLLHASFQGFELLRPITGGDAHCGPYFADRALDATISELAKVAVGVVREIFGRSLDVGQIGKMREMLERARAGREH
jgi:hypothetical protein